MEVLVWNIRSEEPVRPSTSLFHTKQSNFITKQKKILTLNSCPTSRAQTSTVDLAFVTKIFQSLCDHGNAVSVRHSSELLLVVLDSQLLLSNESSKFSSPSSISVIVDSVRSLLSGILLIFQLMIKNKKQNELFG